MSDDDIMQRLERERLAHRRWGKQAAANAWEQAMTTAGFKVKVVRRGDPKPKLKSAPFSILDDVNIYTVSCTACGTPVNKQDSHTPHDVDCTEPEGCQCANEVCPDCCWDAECLA